MPLSAILGIRGLLVHALSEEAKRFYESRLCGCAVGVDDVDNVVEASADVLLRRELVE